MIERSFFERDPLRCAADLIGCGLRWNGCEGIIVETEAYADRDDEASHTFTRPSTRAFIAAHGPGAAYVYLNYGMHWMLNVLVKNGKGNGFVLIRALEPTAGIARMQKRRGQSEMRALCSGPGKLAQALGVRGTDHGIDLCATEKRCFIQRMKKPAIVTDPRIGITRAVHLEWRYSLKGSPFVSVPVKEERERPGVVGRVTSPGAGGSARPDRETRLPMRPKPNRLRRLDRIWHGQNWPHYFLTICTEGRRPILAKPRVHQRLKTFLDGSPKRYAWWPTRYVIMPDHLHLLVHAGADAGTLSNWIKALKAFTSRKEFRWQPSFFDHLLRSEESESEKWEYIRMNPVRAGLVRNPEDWPYAGEISHDNAVG